MTQKLITATQDVWMEKTNVLLRKDNLVFAVVLKNASSWAKTVLRLNGFSEIKISQVNWEKDHVFGFIQEPWRRRAKGIVEDLVSFYSVEQYLLNNLGKKFWTEHLTFGPHSVPLSLVWHGHCEKIDWIPMDHPDVDLVKMMDKIFQHHGMTFVPGTKIDKHRSDPYKKELFEKMQHIIGYGSGTLYLMLARDTDLYQSVMQGFNPKGETWAEISWLKQDLPPANG